MESISDYLSAHLSGVISERRLKWSEGSGAGVLQEFSLWHLPTPSTSIIQDFCVADSAINWGFSVIFSEFF